MGSQAVYVSDKAAQWLAPAGALPSSFLLVRERARTRIIDYQGRKVGVVLFPAAQSFAKTSPDPLQAAMDEALRAGRELAGQVHLLIGVSPWGSEAEKDFAYQAEGLFHILLGGGSGYGFAFAVTGQNGGVLWVRPETDGRSVNVIRLLAWPAPGQHLWQMQANFEASLILLSPQVPENQLIKSLFPE